MRKERLILRFLLQMVKCLLGCALSLLVAKQAYGTRIQEEPGQTGFRVSFESGTPNVDIMVYLKYGVTNLDGSIRPVKNWFVVDTGAHFSSLTSSLDDFTSPQLLTHTRVAGVIRGQGT